jgi:hypothetical protein
MVIMENVRFPTVESYNSEFWKPRAEPQDVTTHHLDSRLTAAQNLRTRRREMKFSEPSLLAPNAG